MTIKGMGAAGVIRARKTLRLSVVAAVVAVLAVTTGEAAAANVPNSVFDQVASEIAGKPVSVYCESDWYTWIKAFEGAGLNGAGVNGFTNLSTPTVFVNPRQCEALWALHRGEDVGTYYAASALFTLVHEAVHQRGITDEGVTDCTAMPLVPEIAVKYFGVTRTVTERYLVSRTERRKVKVGKKSKTITVKTMVESYREVANPWFESFKVDVLRWHKAKPPEYQGNC